jgi:hypothetical protein
MRYILSLALLITACTRANPDAIGGNGGTGGGGGTAGSGGGAGAGGGGGVGSDVDLAMSMPGDLAMPPDMRTLEGVACGDTSCKGGQDCCINNNGQKCTSTNSCSGGQHPTLWACDGPEDCPGTTPGTKGECCANASGSACDPSCTLVSNSAPMCHVAADCPTGYTTCCVIKLLPQYSLCSKQPCPP